MVNPATPPTTPPTTVRVATRVLLPPGPPGDSEVPDGLVPAESPDPPPTTMASSVDVVAMGDEEVKDDGVDIDVRKDEGPDVVWDTVEVLLWSVTRLEDLTNVVGFLVAEGFGVGKEVVSVAELETPESKVLLPAKAVTVLDKWTDRPDQNRQRIRDQWTH